MLMTTDRDGTGLGPIYDGGHTPRISADGEYIIWRDQGSYYLLSENSAEPSLVDGDFLGWGPTGATLTLQKGDVISVLDLEGGGSSVEFAAPWRRGSVAWSPQGSRLAFIDNEDLRVAELDTGTLKSVVALGDEWTTLSWSPDELAIALGMTGKVYRASLDSASIELLIELGDSTAPPEVRWSPDGEWIAWVAMSGDTPGGIVRADGSENMRLKAFAKGAPAWNATSTWVSFLGDPSTHGCFDGTCDSMLIYQPSSAESRSIGVARRMEWAPEDDVLALAVNRFVYDDEIGGKRLLPWRVSVFDLSLREYVELGELDPEDPRTDSEPQWRRTAISP